MKKYFKNGLQSITVTSLIVVLSACGGSGTSTSDTTDNQGASNQNTESSNPAATPAQSNVMVSNDFTFPVTTETDGDVQVTIPSGSAPEFSARRLLKSGQGNVIQFGDPVVLRYKMFSWNSGEIVENTDTSGEPVAVRAGLTDDAPQFLSKSLLGRRVGDQLQIVFENGMEDLPDYLDKNDAYVLVVDLL